MSAGEIAELRVVQVFNGAPIEERRYPVRAGTSVTIGATPAASFIVGGGHAPAPRQLFHCGYRGFLVSLQPEMRGTLHLGGRTVPVAPPPDAGSGASSLPTTSVNRPIGDGDWGIVSLDATGELAFFFQVVARGPRLAPPLTVDGFLVGALGLSGVAFGLLLALAWVLGDRAPGNDDLAAEPERFARLVLEQSWPKKDLEPERDKEEDREKKRKVKAEDMSKRAAGKEGKFGDPSSTRKETRLQKGPRDQVADKVRTTGILGIVQRTRGDSAFGRLLSTPRGDVTQALAGLQGVQTEIGQGSGGMGTRGSGGGGGGTGAGQIHGIGNLDVGTGGNAKAHHAGGGAGRVAKELGVELGQAGGATDGSLSKEQIYKVVASHIAALQFCFEKELQRFPKLQGKVVLGWRVELDGTVSSARVDSTTLSHPPTEGCMVRQLKGWTFPKPAGTIAQVSFPFLFRGR